MRKVKEMTILSMLIALAILLHMVEAAIPLPILIPGFKLGFANIVGLCAWKMFDFKMMLKVNALRIIFASLLSGTIFNVGFYLSISGFVCSSLAMYVAARCSKMSLYGISVAGSVFHNVGQVLMISLIYEQFFMQFFLPFLILLAIPTGCIMAFMAIQVLRRYKGESEYGNLCI